MDGTVVIIRRWPRTRPTQCIVKTGTFNSNDSGGNLSSEKSPISVKVRVEQLFTNPMMIEVSLQIIRERDDFEVKHSRVWEEMRIKYKAEWGMNHGGDSHLGYAVGWQCACPREISCDKPRPFSSQ